MNNILTHIKTNIIKSINVEEVSLVDNSHLHTRHKSFDSSKYHLKIIIKSKKLNKMKKLDAHKLVYSILKDEMSKQIHALEIEII